MTEGCCLGPFTNTLSPSLPKPPISQDVFLVPKVDPLGKAWVQGIGVCGLGGVCWSGASFWLAGMRSELTLSTALRPP